MSAQEQLFDTRRAVAPLAVLLDPSEASDVLVLSFTANLSFFSRHIAGRARSRGARVTVVSDLAQTSFDPDGVRGAGWDWLDGRAWCHGAFHPKLIVVASDTRATVLLGSGNATPAGWVENAELWVRMEADESGAPQAVSDIADWLGRLADAVELSPGVDVSLGSASKRLARFSAGHVMPHFVHNLDRPIWDALPHGPVDELLVSSPFLGGSSGALMHICERLQPGGLTVAYADDFQIDGPSLKRVLDDWNGQVLEIDSDRYHHGKLLEWRRGDSRQALVGSPNCTIAALGRTVADPDGNCEIGLICDLEATLLPPTGSPVSIAGLTERRYAPPTSAPAPLLVAAIVEGTGVRLVLRRPATGELRVEEYRGATWIDTGYRVPAGATEFLCADWRPERALAIRIVSQDGAATTPVAATVVQRLEPRQGSRHDLGGRGGEFLDNPRFLGALQESLARIRAAWLTARGVTPPRLASQAPTSRGKRPTWQEVVERVRVETGERFTWFSLPSLARRAGLWEPEQEGPDDGRTDAQAEAGDDLVTAEELDRAERLEAYRRRRIADLRRWCTRVYQPEALSDAERAARRRAKADASFDPDEVCSEADVAIAAVVLAAHQLDAWADADEEAVVLVRALRRLGKPLSAPELEADVASAVAVGLWILHGLSQASAEPAVLRAKFRGAARAVAPVLSNLDEEALKGRCSILQTRDRPGPPPDDVLELALRVASPDPLADLRERLEEAGIATETEGRVVRLLGPLARDGEPQLIKWLSHAEELSPIALSASTTTAGAVVVAWNRPYLVVTKELPVQRGVLYRLVRGPVVDTDPETGRIDGRLRVAHWYRERPPREALDVLNACGVDPVLTAVEDR